MPETDTFDLDAAFARLEQDVSTRSSSPGADRVFHTVRRRRQVRRGAVAALAVLVVGAGASAVVTHRSDDLGPTTRPFPAPAGLDATVLDKVTAGWAGPWHDLDINATPERTLNPSCRINNDQSGSSGVSGGSGAFQTADGHFVQFGATRWNGGLHTYVSTLTKALEACPGARTTDVTYSDTLHVTFVELPSLAGSTTEWGIVVLGHDVMELAIGPATGLPDEVQARLGDAMVAAIQADATLSGVPQQGANRVAPEGYARFDPERLQHALAGWPSGWHDGRPPNTVQHDPCGSAAWNNAGMTTTIGADGRFWIHRFSSPTAAETGYRRIRDALGTCPGYTLGTVTSPNGPVVLVARGDRDVWAVRHGGWVVVTYLPRAATPPPDPVSDAMGAAMVGVVDDALASYRRANG